MTEDMEREEYERQRYEEHAYYQSMAEQDCANNVHSDNGDGLCGWCGVCQNIVSNA